MKLLTPISKSLFFFFFLLLFINHYSFLSAQAPQKFNYQAVARNGNAVLENATLDVKLEILQGSTTGTMVWTETQTGVSTNDYGLFSIQAGSETEISIDWNDGPYFLKVQVDLGTGFQDFGNSELLSVPFALNTQSVSSLEKLDIQGPVGMDPDSALFEVKRNDGQTIFAVYNSGVRVFVEEGESKGRRGGFAIGGFTPGKGETGEYFIVTSDSVRIYLDTVTAKRPKGGFAIGGFTPGKGIDQEYMRVSQDSVRIYLDNTETKRRKGGFAIGGFTPGKDGDGERDHYFNVFTQSEASIINPSQPRVLWYPKKEAFLTGRVLIESPDSVGTNSMATGFESKSIGANSQAFGYKARAKGGNSTAIGNNANAEGNESYAIGNYAMAQDSGSYAIGSGASATGLRSFAIGSTGIDNQGNPTSSTKATADYAYAFGMGSIASGQGAFTLGTKNTASGIYSLAMGLKSDAIGWYSTSMGLGTKASGHNSTAMGNQTEASNTSSTAMGMATEANGATSTAMGNRSIANGMSSTAMGVLTTANGYYSTAMSGYTTSNGDYSTAMGYQTTSDPYAALVIGRYNVLGGTKTSWQSLDPVFIIGNGSDDSHRNNAVTVLKNGNFGIGTTTPTNTLHVNGTGRIGNTDYTSASIEINAQGSGDRYAYIDFHGDNTYGDYGLRVFRNDDGPNSSSEFRHRGTGPLLFVTQEAAEMRFYTSNLRRMTILSNGRVGIGTSSPAYPLHVETYRSTSFAYGYLNSAGNTGTASGTSNISIFAQQRIRAQEFNADSDIRIKNVKGVSDSKKDLELLKKIKITDYQYIDTIEKGTKIYKKVIAQELQEIYPSAITVTSGFVPSVYSKALSVKYDQASMKMNIETIKSHQFELGDKIKLIHEEGVWTTEVTAVISEKVFVVKSENEYPELFVFGKEVHDFLTVDYEAIAMLNVSVTQELIRNNEEQQQTIESLQEEINKLKSEKSELALLKEQMAELRESMGLVGSMKDD